MKPYIQDFIQNVLLGNGIDVMIPEDEHSNYAMFFVDGQMFYFQEDYFQGNLRFSSNHKPSQGVGTGLGLHSPYEGIAIEDVTIEYIKDLPKLRSRIWGRSPQIKKISGFYNSFEDYLNAPVNRILKYKILRATQNQHIS